MRKILFLFCLCPLIGLTQDLNISNYPFADTEPYLSIDPADPAHLVAAWMHAGAGHMDIKTAVSYDGGLTWPFSSVLPHYSPSFSSADVSIAFDKTGNAYIAYVDFKQTQDSGYVLVRKSGNGGKSWGNASIVSGINFKQHKPIDRPWIVADRSSGPYSGRLYVTTKSGPDEICPCQVWLSTSSDQALTWSPLQRIDSLIPQGNTVNSMAVPTCGPDGKFYVAYYSYDPSLSPYARMICGMSADGGQTFDFNIVKNFTGSGANSDTLLQSSYNLAANPADPANLIAILTEKSSTDLDLYLSYSMDYGKTWSSVKKINTDPSGNGNNQDMCWSGFSPGGNFVMAWRDRRNFSGDSKSNFEIFYAVSADKGISINPEKKLSKGNSPYINMSKGNDFIGVAASDKKIFCNWSDLRTGNTDIFFQSDSLLITSIEKINEYVSIIYPNPSIKGFCLDNAFHQPVVIKIFDLQGKLVREINVSAKEQHISFGEDLPPGEYIARILSGNHEYLQRIIKR